MAKDIQEIIIQENIIRDALYNTCQQSGASMDYGRGVVVGLMSGLLAYEMIFEEAAKLMKSLLPENFRHDTIPRSWWRRFGLDV